MAEAPSSTPEIANAEHVLERLINNRLFAHGRPDHPQFLTSAVKIGVGFESGGTAQKEPHDILQLTLKDPHADTIPSGISDVALKVSAEIPALQSFHPTVHKDPAKPGEMTVQFTLPKGKAFEVIQAIAKLGPTPVHSHPRPETFAKVDSIELVAAASERAAKTAQDILAKFFPDMVQKPVQDIPVMNPEAVQKLAENIVLKVEEASKALESAGMNVPAAVAEPITQAHNAIRSAINMEAKSRGWVAKMQDKPQGHSHGLGA